MLWIDITDPKYALFFSAFLRDFCALDCVLITTRTSATYNECARILARIKSSSTLTHRLQVVSIGGYGGGGRDEKYRARLAREEGFLRLFADIGTPRVFISGASVEGAQCAYGLGIPIVHFSDTPISGHKFLMHDITHVARLSLPLSHMLFHPFVIPSMVYQVFGLAQQDIYEYGFLDVALWLDEAFTQQESSFFNAEALHINDDMPLIIAREEEYKAHYVRAHLPLWQESIKALAQEQVQIVIIPRYGIKELEACFQGYDNIMILNEVIPPQAIYKKASLLLGGGGTMNLEACFLGIPTISTRSLLLYHDCYLIEQGLMRHECKLEGVLEAFYHYRAQGFVRASKERCKKAFIMPNGTSANLRKEYENIVRAIAQRYYT